MLQRIPRFLFVLFALLVGAACTAPAAPPTLIPLADTPVLAVVETPEVAAVGEMAETAAAPAAILPTTPAPPTPEGVGVRPSQAEQLWAPDAGPLEAVNDRPPPLPVPLSLNPDDHYWLLRPIPSDRRNYDLEWYPYGSDVLKPDVGAYRIHHGLDFPNETGTPVLAAGSGTVVHAGALPSPRNGVNYYGNTVVILHDWQWQGKDVYTLYAHTLELFVSVGEGVEAGQLIAGVGSSGEVSGPHLHFEVRVGQNTYGHTRNPSLWLAPFEGWGTIAGQFVDKNGRFISSAPVKIRPLSRNQPVRDVRTYAGTVQPDDLWQENFVIADLPAGSYEVLITGIDNIQYLREVDVYPGQTSFVVVSTNFEFNPTATPILSATPAPIEIPAATAVPNPTPASDS